MEMMYWRIKRNYLRIKLKLIRIKKKIIHGEAFVIDRIIDFNNRLIDKLENL